MAAPSDVKGTAPRTEYFTLGATVSREAAAEATRDSLEVEWARERMDLERSKAQFRQQVQQQQQVDDNVSSLLRRLSELPSALHCAPQPPLAPEDPDGARSPVMSTRRRSSRASTNRPPQLLIEGEGGSSAGAPPASAAAASSAATVAQAAVAPVDAALASAVPAATPGTATTLTAERPTTALPGDPQHIGLAAAPACSMAIAAPSSDNSSRANASVPTAPAVGVAAAVSPSAPEPPERGADSEDASLNCEHHQIGTPSSAAADSPMSFSGPQFGVSKGLPAPKQIEAARPVPVGHKPSPPPGGPPAGAFTASQARPPLSAPPADAFIASQTRPPPGAPPAGAYTANQARPPPGAPPAGAFTASQARPPPGGPPAGAFAASHARPPAGSPPAGAFIGNQARPPPGPPPSGAFTAAPPCGPPPVGLPVTAKPPKPRRPTADNSQTQTQVAQAAPVSSQSGVTPSSTDQSHMPAASVNIEPTSIMAMMATVPLAAGEGVRSVTDESAAHPPELTPTSRNSPSQPSSPSVERREPSPSTNRQRVLPVAVAGNELADGTRVRALVDVVVGDDPLAANATRVCDSASTDVASVRETSQAAGSADSVADVWHGWTIETSRDGRLFYHHASSSTSQWNQPRELNQVLGEWGQMTEQNGTKYWRNELLGVSSWKDPQKTTNIFQAALSGNLFFLQLYSEVGGFLDAADGKGRTALHYNCAGGSVQAVLHLLHSRATVDVLDQEGSVALHWGCRYGHAQIVRLLLEAKSNPDTQNRLGDTPLHEAARLGRVEPLQWLVLAGASPLLRDREGRTAVEAATANRAVEAAALLAQWAQDRRWRQGSQKRPSVASDTSGGTTPAATPRTTDREEVVDEEGSDSEADESEPSLALAIVRTARPLLRGVQWLANRVLGERKMDLGSANGYTFDSQTQRWVLAERTSGPCPSDGWDSDASGSDDEEEDEAPAPQPQHALARHLRRARAATRRSEPDGTAAGV